MKSHITTITAIKIAAVSFAFCIGGGLIVVGLLVAFFSHHGSVLPFWFSMGILNLLSLVDLNTLAFLFLPSFYWGGLAWIASCVEKIPHIILCWLLFLLLQVIFPYWFFFHLETNEGSKFLRQLGNPDYIIIIESIVAIMANVYVFVLPIVFWWLSRKKRHLYSNALESKD
jgi:hypothetical protein